MAESMRENLPEKFSYKIYQLLKANGLPGLRHRITKKSILRKLAIQIGEPAI
jgi:hypothetical protein